MLTRMIAADVRPDQVLEGCEGNGCALPRNRCLRAFVPLVSTIPFGWCEPVRRLQERGANGARVPFHNVCGQAQGNRVLLRVRRLRFVQTIPSEVDDAGGRLV